MDERRHLVGRRGGVEPLLGNPPQAVAGTYDQPRQRYCLVAAVVCRWVPAWLSGCVPTGRAGTGSGAFAEAVADDWSGPAPTRATPSPVSRSRRNERGQPTQAVAGSRPADVASTTAAIPITTAQAAQPRRTQAARASSRSSYSELAGCRSGSVASSSHRVAAVTRTSARTAVETERALPRCHGPMLSFACVCIRQRSDSSGVNHLSTDRLRLRAQGHERSHGLGSIDVRPVRRPRAAGRGHAPRGPGRRRRRPEPGRVRPGEPRGEAARVARSRPAGAAGRGSCRRWPAGPAGRGLAAARGPYGGVGRPPRRHRRRQWAGQPGRPRGDLVGDGPADAAHRAPRAVRRTGALPGALRRRQSGRGSDGQGRAATSSSCTWGRAGRPASRWSPWAPVTAFQGRPG